ncbi:MAG: hypothetical protein ACHQF4_02115 [Sphingobacteriales bacterium]
MNKSEILKEISLAASRNQVTKNEIDAAFDLGIQQPGWQADQRHTTLAEVFYYVGAGIIFLGIIILVEQNWSYLNSVARLLVTFGVSIGAYIIAALFSKAKRVGALSAVFFMISGLLLPVGAYVLLDVTGINWGGPGVQTAVALVSLLIFLLSGFIFRKNIFLFFSILFGTWFFQALMIFLFGKSFNDLYPYIILASGLIYLLLGKYFAETAESSFTPWLYSFGCLGFLGSALYLGGFSPNQNIFWELIFPILDFALIFFSVRLRSKAFLIFGALFLMLYIIKITTEYFANSLGWPFVLVLSGFLLIGVGYSTWRINHKYL